MITGIVHINIGVQMINVISLPPLNQNANIMKKPKTRNN
nr:MAG TPA: hypothetical protein [Caudoviricetes sp.]